MKKFFLLLAIIATIPSTAQTIDTVTVMTYNLMWYRGNPSFCTPPAASTRDGAMEDIIDHVLPDLLVVNEMDGNNSISPARLQLNALNKNGRSYYKSARVSGSGSLRNMLYYNSDKFLLEGQTEVTKDLSNSNLVRAIDIYTLRYVDTNLATHKDTTRIRIIAAHLKAGNSTADETERGEATEAVMAYLDSNKIDGNILFAGDLNLYKSSEPAYQDLVSYVDTNLRFFDPVNTPGNWSNRSVYASLHTQSTRSSGSGCFVGGGMDDRFDFILASKEIIDNDDKIEYISNTYEALGQDGRRFNGSINSPANTSEPAAVITALNDMSDHLPVIMDLKITLPMVTSLAEKSDVPKLHFVNPASQTLKIDLNRSGEKIRKIELLNISGQLLREVELSGVRWVKEDISNFKSGTYLIRVTYDSFQQSIEKLIKI